MASGLLETLRAVGQHQCVAVPHRLALRLDWRRLVDNAGIVEQQQAPGLGQGEALAMGCGGLEDACLTALHSAARHQEHRHQVDAVAMRPFRRGPADAIGGVDAKLVGF